jgi:hypothetical protein
MTTNEHSLSGVSEQQLLEMLSRDDFRTFMERAFYELLPGTTFVPGWHIDYLCAKLETCLKGENRRLIINMPPRHMKSLLVSVGFVAFMLGQDPRKKIICVSYSKDLAVNEACLHEGVGNCAVFGFELLQPSREGLDEPDTGTEEGIAVVLHRRHHPKPRIFLGCLGLIARPAHDFRNEAEAHSVVQISNSESQRRAVLTRNFANDPYPAKVARRKRRTRRNSEEI